MTECCARLKLWTINEKIEDEYYPGLLGFYNKTKNTTNNHSLYVGIVNDLANQFVLWFNATPNRSDGIGETGWTVSYGN